MAAEDEREAKRKRYTSRIITLKVGAAKEELSVQEGILTDDSPFFRAALERKWQEGKDGIVELPEDWMDTVTGYIHWLYRGEIVKATMQAPEGAADYNFLARLVVFGEKIQSKGFYNAATAAICAGIDEPDKKGIRQFPGGSAVGTVFDGLPAGAPVRRLLIDAFAQQGCAKWFSDPQQTFPHQFLMELMESMMSRRDPETHRSFLDRKSEWEKK